MAAARNSAWKKREQEENETPRGMGFGGAQKDSL